VTGLSVLARGTVEEKLEWAFGLYDINGDGVIGRDEMLNVVTAIYDMIGKCAVPAVDECAIIEHVDNIFQVTTSCETFCDSPYWPHQPLHLVRSVHSKTECRIETLNLVEVLPK